MVSVKSRWDVIVLGHLITGTRIGLILFTLAAVNDVGVSRDKYMLQPTHSNVVTMPSSG